MIRSVAEDDLKSAIELVNKVFAEFVAVDYSEQGQKTFQDYLKEKYNAFVRDMRSGQKKMWCYCEKGRIIGVIATRDISHIALLFVAKEYQRRGIAKQLFTAVLHEIQKEKGIREITVNSSPYAVPVYRRMGFEQTAGEMEKNGIRYTPMKFTL